MSNDSESLQTDCDGIHRGCAEAIEWVAEVRGNSSRLDREAESLIMKVRRMRNLARRLGQAASRPMSIGFFGLSQAGKSYLISVLAAGENGDLETLLDGERLNFIDHVNPPGHGKESTGLVTRFTRHAVQAPTGFPIQLTLFSEADLIKILGNAFFNDFDRQQVTFNTEPEEIRKLLSSLQKKRQAQPTGGMDEDEVVDLYDYFDKRFTNDMKPLMGDYWPSVIELAPYLMPNDRATLFAVLWGGFEELTQTYLRLRQALETAQYADTLYCPISALVVPGSGGGWSQENSIMNVTILNRLGLDDDDRIEVQPVRGEETMATVELPRSIIAVLTAEMRFELAEAPAEEILETVDLLDFPGYRGRLKVRNMDEVRAAVKNDRADPVAELMLRGKVAYLFERYTDNQEMNVLVVCAASDKQSDVSDMGPVLEAWIHSTQGGSPEQRQGKIPGLMWAMTRFDMKLQNMLGSTAENMGQAWEGMTDLALTEKFGHYEWLQQWTPDGAFNNVFLTRKPRMEGGIINVEADRETGIDAKYEAIVAQLKSTFLVTESIQRHFDTPEQAWDAVMKFDDGGMGRLAGFLEKAAKLENKLARIREQADTIIDELANHRLGAYYQKEGAEAVDTKTALAREVVGVLNKRASRFGELLKALQLPAERLRAIYLRSEEDVDAADGDGADTAAPDADPFAAFGEGDSLIDLNLGQEEDEPQAAVSASNGAGRFAQDALTDWISQLREMPEHHELLQFLGLPKKTVEVLGDELITGADRLKLEQQLIRALNEAEGRTSATRHKLVERQVLVVRTLLNDFVDFLNNSKRPLNERAASVAVKGRVLFEPEPPLAPGTLPELPPRPINYSAMYILDWFEAFKQLAIDNAGYAAGREITPQQNQRLGEIIAVIAGESGGGAAQPGV